MQVPSIDHLPQAAATFLEALKKRTVVAFYGEMGAGKTTFIKALCAQLGVEDLVSSPTFAIINEYYIPKRRTSLYHFDFYRINSLDEAVTIGIEEYFTSGKLCLIEWPERVAELLPPDTLKVQINILPDSSRDIIYE